MPEDSSKTTLKKVALRVGEGNSRLQAAPLQASQESLHSPGAKGVRDGSRLRSDTRALGQGHLQKETLRLGGL